MDNLPLDRFDEAIASRRAWAVDRLASWVRHPSVLGHEASAQEYAAALYEEVGLETRVLPIDHDKIAALPGYSPADWSYAGRPNVVGIHRVGEAAGRSLALNGHVDVVSPEPRALWSGDPFEPVIETRDGIEWMRGRGAGDMKGGSMCFLWALAALRDMGLAPASEVQCHSPIEEECTGNGALAILADERHRTDACVIPEPFAQTILVRQIGVVWFQVRVLGRTTHVLGAGRGVNAIEKSWTIIRALRALEEELNAPERIPPGYAGIAHPLNLNVGTISGGDWASTVAGECVTRFRLALFPGEGLADLRTRVEACVVEAAQSDPWLREFPPRVEWIGFQADGCEFDPASPIGAAIGSAHREVEGAEAKHLAATCTTDVRFYNLYHGIPATCYGPAATDIHGPDERVDLASMQRVARVFGRLIANWCGVRTRSSR